MGRVCAWRDIYRGNSGYNFTKLELVKDGGLSGGVETDHQNTHLLQKVVRPVSEIPEQEFKCMGQAVGAAAQNHLLGEELFENALEAAHFC
jgi:hypothetical protein